MLAYRLARTSGIITGQQLTVRGVYYVGVDLAWGLRSPTGVAVVDDDGVLRHVGVPGDDDDVSREVVRNGAHASPSHVRSPMIFQAYHAPHAIRSTFFQERRISSGGVGSAIIARIRKTTASHREETLMTSAAHSSGSLAALAAGLASGSIRVVDPR